MKISTKKLVSSIVALCLLFTTVFSNTVLVSASSKDEDGNNVAVKYTVDANSETATYLPGLTYSTSTDAETNVKTTAWGVDSTATFTVDGSTIQIGAGDSLEGLIIGGSTKSWSSSNGIALSTTMSMKVPVDELSSEGTISITCLGTNSDRYLTLTSSSDSKTIAYNKNSVQTLSFTSSDATDGYLVFSVAGGDYKMSNITLAETLSDGTTSGGGAGTGGSSSEGGSTSSGTTYAGTANFTASVDKSVYTAEDKFDVVYTLSDLNGTDLSNFTGYIEYNENVVMLESMELLGVTYAVDTIVTNSVEGYEALADGESIAMNEYGKVKVTYTDPNEGYGATIDEGTVLELHFSTVAVGSANIKYVPIDFVNSSNGLVDVTITNPSVKVVSEDTVVIAAEPADTSYSVGDTFTVDFTINKATDFSNMAGTIKFDSAVVELTDLSAAEAYADYFTGDAATAAVAIDGKASGVPFDFTTTADETLFTATFKALAEGTAAISYSSTSMATSNNIAVEVVADSTSVVISAAKEASEVTLNVVPQGATADDSGVYTYTFTENGDKTIDVAYNVTNNTAGIANADLFVEFDPQVLVPTEITDGIIATGGLEEIVPSADSEDYKAYGADGEKTNIELGAIKVVGYTSDLLQVTGDATLFTVTYEVIGLTDSTTLSAAVPTNEDGTANWGAPSDTSKTEWARAITVNNAEAALKGDLGDMVFTVDFYGTTPDGVTDNGDGTYTVSSDVTSFEAAISVTNNTGIESFTANLDYDGSLVTATSVVAGSKLLSENVISEAMALTPTSANTDFTGLDADGTKTAAELGRLHFAESISTTYNIDEYASNGAIAVIEFTRVTDEEGTPYSGDLTIALTELEVTDADLTEVSFTTNDLVCVLEGAEPVEEETTKLHVLGKVSHDSSTSGLGIADASKILSYVRNSNGVSDTDKDIADINGDGKMAMVDASYALSKVRNSTFMFSEIEGGRGTDSSAEGYITVDGFKEYINVPSDYECDCAEVTIA